MQNTKTKKINKSSHQDHQDQKEQKEEKEPLSNQELEHEIEKVNPLFWAKNLNDPEDLKKGDQRIKAIWKTFHQRLLTLEDPETRSGSATEEKDRPKTDDPKRIYLIIYQEVFKKCKDWEKVNENKDRLIFIGIGKNELAVRQMIYKLDQGNHWYNPDHEIIKIVELGKAHEQIEDQIFALSYASKDPRKILQD